MQKPSAVYFQGRIGAGKYMHVLLSADFNNNRARGTLLSCAHQKAAVLVRIPVARVRTEQIIMSETSVSEIL